LAGARREQAHRLCYPTAAAAVGAPALAGLHSPPFGFAQGAPSAVEGREYAAGQPRESPPPLSRL